MTPGSAEEPSVPAGATRAGKVALDQVAPNRRRGEPQLLRRAPVAALGAAPTSVRATEPGATVFT